ncbi:hypothetical protein [Nocardia sp. NPDC051981]|uniref:hypothetical protein n=1 Tax=Nocardia sp. NPDC051981 TaxID=3155417 RepID=UPI003436BCB6
MAAPVVAWPDATLLAMEYLRPRLGGMPVGSRIPADRPVEFVVLRRVGGPQRGPLTDDARLDVQVWADSDERAVAIAAQARYHLGAMPQHVPEVRQFREDSGPNLIPDAPSDVPRVLLTVVLSVRGAVPT